LGHQKLSFSVVFGGHGVGVEALAGNTRLKALLRYSIMPLHALIVLILSTTDLGQRTRTPSNEPTVGGILSEDGLPAETGIDGLVERLAAAEADAAIELDGPVIVGGHFEKSPVHPLALKAVQGLKQESTAEPAAALAGDDAEVLDRARSRPFADALDSAA